MIGEAFTAAYRDFLALNGIKEEDIEEAELNHVLNSQSASCVELDSFVDDSKTKQVCNSGCTVASNNLYRKSLLELNKMNSYAFFFTTSLDSVS